MARDTKDRLEATALRLFCEKGISEVSVRDLAAAMNTRESSLNRHMVSKDDLVAGFSRPLKKGCSLQDPSADIREDRLSTS